MVILTVYLSGGQLSIEQFQVRDAVEDVQEGLGEPQEIAETVEPEVDELPGQLDHLEGELVLFRVAESPDVVDDVLEVGFDEDDGRVKASANHLFGRVRCLVGVVAENDRRIHFCGGGYDSLCFLPSPTLLLLFSPLIRLGVTVSSIKWARKRALYPEVLHSLVFA